MQTGIYKLTFTGTPKVYVGQALHIPARYTRHRNYLSKGTHSIKMNKAFKERGMPSLEVILECKAEELNDTENFFISEYDAVDNGFNTARCAAGGSSLSGEDHPLSKYPNSTILESIEFIVEHPELTLQEISKHTGVSNSVISHIFKGDRHTWVNTEYPYLCEKLQELRIYKSYGESKGSSKTTNAIAIEIFNILVDARDIPFKEIADNYNVSIDTINSISKGSSYKWLKEVFPERYSLLMSLKGSRGRHTEVGNRISVKALGIIYPKVLSPSGKIFEVDNISAFAREHSLDKSTFHRLLNLKAKTHKGWKVCPEEQAS